MKKESGGAGFFVLLCSDTPSQCTVASLNARLATTHKPGRQLIDYQRLKASEWKDT